MTLADRSVSHYADIDTTEKSNRLCPSPPALAVKLFTVPHSAEFWSVDGLGVAGDVVQLSLEDLLQGLKTHKYPNIAEKQG